MLYPGLYEQVINNALNRELADIPEARKSTAPIDTAEAAKVLAQYLPDVVQKGLENVQDNGGGRFPGGTPELRLPEPVTARKEFCNCTFAWDFGTPGAHGQSLGKTLPAIPTEPKLAYLRQALTAENAVALPCEQVLGAYRVAFRR